MTGEELRAIEKHLRIKDCPFCVGKAVLVVERNYHDDEIAYITCEDCLCRTEDVPLSGEGVAKIVEKWNARLGV